MSTPQDLESSRVDPLGPNGSITAQIARHDSEIATLAKGQERLSRDISGIDHKIDDFSEKVFNKIDSSKNPLGVYVSIVSVALAAFVWFLRISIVPLGESISTLKDEAAMTESRTNEKLRQERLEQAKKNDQLSDAVLKLMDREASIESRLTETIGRQSLANKHYDTWFKAHGSDIRSLNKIIRESHEKDAKEVGFISGRLDALRSQVQRIDSRFTSTVK